MKPVGYYNLRELAQDFLKLEYSLTELLKEGPSERASLMRIDYNWDRAQFILKLADLCGESADSLDLNPHDTVLEFSL